MYSSRTSCFRCFKFLVRVSFCYSVLAASTSAVHWLKDLSLKLSAVCQVGCKTTRTHNHLVLLLSEMFTAAKPARKRRWGSTSGQQKPVQSINISTDSLRVRLSIGCWQVYGKMSHVHVASICMFM